MLNFVWIYVAYLYYNALRIAEKMGEEFGVVSSPEIHSLALNNANRYPQTCNP